MKYWILIILFMVTSTQAAPAESEATKKAPEAPKTEKKTSKKAAPKAEAKLEVKEESKTEKAFEFSFPRQSQILTMTLGTEKDAAADLESCKIEVFTADAEYKLNCYLDARIKLLETFMFPESIFVDMRASGLFTEDKLFEPKAQSFEGGQLYAWTTPSATPTTHYYVCPTEGNHCYRVRLHSDGGLNIKFDLKTEKK